MDFCKFTKLGLFCSRGRDGGGCPCWRFLASPKFVLGLWRPGKEVSRFAGRTERGTTAVLAAGGRSQHLILAGLNAEVGEGGLRSRGSLYSHRRNGFLQKGNTKLRSDLVISGQSPVPATGCLANTRGLDVLEHLRCCVQRSSLSEMGRHQFWVCTAPKYREV